LKSRPKCAASIGIFDGVHLAHSAILKRVVSQAKAGGLKSLLISFYPHPMCFYHKKFSGYITLPEEKIRILEETGLNYFWQVKFDKKIAGMSGEEFINYVLRFFNIKKIIVGSDFKLGRKAETGVKKLSEICGDKGVGIEAVKQIRKKGFVVKSSLVRRLIRKRDFHQAGLFLGRPYFISGIVRKGRGIGKGLLVPTINLSVEDKVLPPDGVYLSKVRYKNRVYPAVSYLGIPPSFKGRRRVFETHIIGFNKDIYKDFAEVVLIRHLRRQYRFKYISNLKVQIKEDINIAENFFSSHNILRFLQPLPTTH